ncbi:hypothetical protein H4219_002595 [Mycoemilia scoparia]|uniref:Uncharacterized protein n=1 Tax=Mycoemilia scoparia TaxID=417184 RepID=A0A9W8A546_9FUNG|nr:hypothetical protein H4219_002595 [Mycoemilia scoparia]
MDSAIPRVFSKSLKQMRSLRALTSSFSTTSYAPLPSYHQFPASAFLQDYGSQNRDILQCSISTECASDGGSSSNSRKWADHYGRRRGQEKHQHIPGNYSPPTMGPISEKWTKYTLLYNSHPMHRGRSAALGCFASPILTFTRHSGISAATGAGSATTAASTLSPLHTANKMQQPARWFSTSGSIAKDYQHKGRNASHDARTWSYFADQDNEQGGAGDGSLEGVVVDSYYSPYSSHISAVSSAASHYAHDHEISSGILDNNNSDPSGADFIAFSEDLANNHEAVWYERSQAREAMKAASNIEDHRVLPTGGHWKTVRVNESLDNE